MVDDVRIDASGIDIDGPGAVIGQAGPTVLRPASAGAAAGLSVIGVMEFDSADLAELERAGTLHDVIAHEGGPRRGRALRAAYARRGAAPG